MRLGTLSVAVTTAAVLTLAQLVSASAATTEHGYVTNRLQLPVTSTQARALGRDLDGDGDRDNQLGQVFAALAGQGLDLQSMQDAAVSSGAIEMLHSLRAPSLSNTTSATWQVLYGVPVAHPDYTGAGSFTVDSSAPRSLRIPAKINDHQVRTAVGSIPVRLTLDSVFTLQIAKARLFSTCTRTSCSAGRINGAVRMKQINGQLIPQFAKLFTSWIQRDCPTADTCTEGSSGRAAEQMFDPNHDLVVTTTELRNNNLIKALLAPDVDLDHDGVKDAMSFGVGFHAVHARLVRP